MAVTIKEIASIAGVSRGTVDKVIHNRPGLRPETYEKVKKVLDDLNYSPHPLAKALVEQHEPCKIGVIMTPDYNPFIQDMLKGIKRAKEEYQFFGLEVEVYQSKSLETQDQLDALDYFERSKVNGIAILPVNTQKVASKVNSLIDSGIQVMTFNSKNTDIRSPYFMGQDNYKAGRIAAGLMKRTLPNGGKVGVIISTQLLSCHSERLSGFRTQLAEYYPPITIVDVRENIDRGELSEEIAKSYFKDYPDLDGIYITGGGKGGLVPALDSKPEPEKHCVVIGHDLTANAVSMLLDNKADYIINQRAEEQGYLIIKIFFEYYFRDIIPQQFFEAPIEIMIKESIYSPNSLS